MFGRINISDSPMNLFITSHCVGNNSFREKLCIFSPRGDSPVRNEEKSQFAVSPSSRPVLDTCFHFTAPDDIPSSLVPKQSLRGPLMFCCSYLRKIKEGKNLTLRDTGPFQSLSRPLFPHFAVVEHAGSQREFGCFPPGEL